MKEHSDKLVALFWYVFSLVSSLYIAYLTFGPMIYAKRIMDAALNGYLIGITQSSFLFAYSLLFYYIETHPVYFKPSQPCKTSGNYGDICGAFILFTMMFQAGTVIFLAFFLPIWTVIIYSLMVFGFGYWSVLYYGD